MGIYIDRVRDDETMVMCVFFDKADLYLKVKSIYKYTYRYTIQGYREQLSHTKSEQAPRKN